MVLLLHAAVLVIVIVVVVVVARVLVLVATAVLLTLCKLFYLSAVLDGPLNARLW